MSELSEWRERRKNERQGKRWRYRDRNKLNSRLKSTLLWLKNHLIPFSPPISVIIKCLKHSKSHMYVAKPTKRKKTLVLFLFCSYFNWLFFKDRAIFRYYSLLSSHLAVKVILFFFFLTWLFILKRFKPHKRLQNWPWVIMYHPASPSPFLFFFFAREKVNGSLSLFPNPPTEKQRQ